jgi:hypothetical protein
MVAFRACCSIHSRPGQGVIPAKLTRRLSKCMKKQRGMPVVSADRPAAPDTAPLASYKDAGGLAQAKGLPSLIYHETVLEVRFMRGAAGTTRILTKRAPKPGSYRSRQCHWWDFPDLLTWPQVRASVRVVRSLETYTVRRQLDKQDDLQQSDWIWVTTLSLAQFPVDRIVHLGHQRWDIENYGFNELANEWHSDHIFKHDSGAIECFLLVAFLAYNIFHVFLARNVKPAVRQVKSEIFWARLIAAELYSEVVPAGMSP